MKRPVSVIVLVAALACVCDAGAASVQQWTITQAQWSGVVTAGQVVALAPLRAAIRVFDATPGARLVVIHNGGENGLFWTADLTGWLVALGVPSTRIVERTAAIPPTEIRLRVEPPAGN